MKKVYKIPKKVYDKVWEEIKSTKDPLLYNVKRFIDSDPHKHDSNERVDHFCFLKTNRDFTSVYGLWKGSNFTTAAKQAFEKKDFKVLYKIINKGLEIEDVRCQIPKVLYNYLYAAIEQDPVIEEEERETMLIEVARECMLKYSKRPPFIGFEKEQDVITHVTNAHKFVKRHKDESSDDESENEVVNKNTC